MKKKSIVKMLSIACTVSMCISGVKISEIGNSMRTVEAAEMTEKETEVNIPDAHLNQLICDTLGKQEGDKITKADMERLTKLNSDSMPYIESPAEDLKEHNRGIESLEGLQYAVNLQTLDLSENRITDLSPLKNLKKLTSIDLDRNNIFSLEPLRNMTQLERLNIYNNFISGIEPLGNLKNLKFLDMHFANRRGERFDHSPLGKLTNLEYLSIESNGVEDISFLRPVAESGNLKTILVRANHITDFSVLENLLTQEYQEMWPGGMPGFEEQQETAIMVGTTNQSVNIEGTNDIQIPSKGGEYRIPLPEIKGKGGVEKHFETIMSIFEMESLIQVNFSGTEPEGVELSYDVKQNEAVLQFAENKVGVNREFTGELEIAFYGTDLSVYVPVHYTQKAEYGMDVSIENKKVLHIDTRGEEYISEDYIVGRINRNGNEKVQLEDVKVEFKGNCLWDSSIPQNIFRAVDLQIMGNTFRFKIAIDKEQALNGNFILQPTITFKVQGDEEEYVADRTFNIQNVYVSPTDSVSWKNCFVFDISKQNENGTFTSEPFQLDIPDHYRKISWVEVTDMDGNRTLISDEQELSDYAFTITVPKEGLQEKYKVRVLFQQLERVAPLEFEIGTELIYTVQNSGIEDNVTVQPDKMYTGEEKEPEVTWNGQTCKTFHAYVQENEIISVKDERIRALKPGVQQINISGIRVDMEMDGTRYSDVLYLSPIKHEITVVDKVENLPGQDKEETEKNEKPEKKAPKTADELSILLYGVGILAAVMGFKKFYK